MDWLDLLAVQGGEVKLLLSETSYALMSSKELVSNYATVVSGWQDWTRILFSKMSGNTINIAGCASSLYCNARFL